MAKNLSDFPRVSLCHQPTALEEMPRLSAALGGPRLWIKRDDCTGLASGGNKTRKLEFLIADALNQGADILVTQDEEKDKYSPEEPPKVLSQSLLPSASIFTTQ